MVWVKRGGTWSGLPHHILCTRSMEMGESDHYLQIQQQSRYESIEEPLEESERRRDCRCKLDGSVIKLIGATFCIAGAIATCTCVYTCTHYFMGSLVHLYTLVAVCIFMIRLSGY